MKKLLNGAKTLCLKKMGKMLFMAKYKLGLAIEGKDFFTCGQYDMCPTCTKENGNCANLF